MSPGGQTFQFGNDGNLQNTGGLSLWTTGFQLVATLRGVVMRNFGARAATREAYAALGGSPRDWLRDCPACVAGDDSFYYRWQGQW